ncbi:MAG: type VI secretion system tip protein TssI/VgrG [Pseudomonadota bacterium]
MSLTPAVSAELSLAAAPHASLRVMRIEGREGLSQPYRFELLLLADDRALDTTALPGPECQLTFAVGSVSRRVAGLCWDLEAEQQGVSGHYLYRLVLVPKLEELKLSRQTQIFGGDRSWSLPDMARAFLIGDGALGPGREAALGLAEADIDLRLQHSHPARDFVLQYQESDFDFLSRQMETEGVFYFFESGPEGERLVLADDTAALTSLANGPSELEYQPRRSLARPSALGLYDLELEVQSRPERIIVTDYNEAQPRTDLAKQTVVDAQGHGVHIYAREHYHSPAEGDALAEIRAAELASHGLLLRGASNAPHLVPGQRFSLTDHPSPSFNGSYLVTKVTHSMDLQTKGTAQTAAVYENRFEAIPATAPFAPERKTKKPHVGGVHLGVIGGRGTDERSEIDDQGHYRVRFKFDLSGREDGVASCPIRRLQPSGGENAGFHFPLARGTEVAIGFEKGDPDRPIILGALDNPSTPSVSSDKSRLINRIRTAAGSSIELKDSPTAPGLASDMALALATRTTGEHQNDTQRGLIGAATPSDITYLRGYVTDSDHDDQETYLRMGGYEASSEASAIDAAFADIPATDRSGIFTSTDGAQITVVVGSEEVTVGGNRRLVVVGSGDDPNQTLLIGNDETTTEQSLTIYGDQTQSIGGDLELVVKDMCSQEISGNKDIKVGGDRDITVEESDTEYSYGDKRESLLGLSTKTYYESYESHTLGQKTSFLVGGELKTNFTAVQLTRASSFSYNSMYIEQHPVRWLRMYWNIKVKGIGKVMRTDLNFTMSLSKIETAALKAHQKGYWALY